MNTDDVCGDIPFSSKNGQIAVVFKSEIDLRLIESILVVQVQRNLFFIISRSLDVVRRHLGAFEKVVIRTFLLLIKDFWRTNTDKKRGIETS